METGNATYCNEYKYSGECFYFLGKKTQNLSICNLMFSEETSLAGCKAAILEDNNYCRNHMIGNSNMLQCRDTQKMLIDLYE